MLLRSHAVKTIGQEKEIVYMFFVRFYSVDLCHKYLPGAEHREYGYPLNPYSEKMGCS